MNYRLLIFPLVFCLLSIVPVTTHAVEFNPDFVVSDADLVNSSSMGLTTIRRFLQAKGTLGGYVTEDLDGKRKSAADIIYRVANDWGVSPKFIMVMMQKEQSIVEHPNPSERALDWATGYAVCDSCSKDDPGVGRFRGFAKQLDSMAQQFTLGYMADLAARGQTQTRIAPGRTVQIDNVAVTPVNDATAAMYTYTPHIEGNENFWRIWNQWFTGATHPSGTVLRDVTDGSLWLIKFGKRRAIPSASVLSSYFNPDLVVDSDTATLLNYEEASPLSFPNYSLVRVENGDVYLLVGDEKRRFQSLDDLAKFGYAPDEIIDASMSELEGYDPGSTITFRTEYPQGVILRDSETGMRYYIDGTYKHAIVHDAIFNQRFANWIVHESSSTELAEYFDGLPITLPDGSLVKVPTDPTVYVISDGKRRPIIDETTFLELGFSWSNIVTMDVAAVNVHYPGATLSLEF